MEVTTILLAFRQQSVSLMFEELITNLTDFDVFTLSQGKNLLQKHFDILIVEPEIQDLNDILEKANIILWAGSKPNHLTIGSEMPIPISYTNLKSFLEMKAYKNNNMVSKGVFLDVKSQTISVDYTYDDNDKVTKISLTEKETLLLEFLLHNPAGVSRNLILKEVWGYENDIETKTVETHISTLRTKLENNLQNITIQAQDSTYKIYNEM